MTELLLVVAVSAVAATVQATTGSGLTLVAAPALVVIDDAFLPAPILIAGVVIASRHAIVERSHINRSAIVRALAILPFGMGVGWAARAALSPAATDIAIGGTICITAAVLLTGRSPRRVPATELAGGFAGGLAGILAGLPGPPLVLALSDLKPAALRSTTSVFILAVAVLTVVSLTVAGDFGTHELELTLLLAPGIAFGLIAGRHL
ncbi:MAG: TSUP family transporter, partial [Actinomycetia bacterium]|nr:TSUP family transporter [Actinomycetes bacterium]